jgi:hypothetical protein
MVLSKTDNIGLHKTVVKHECNVTSHYSYKF